MSTIKVNNLESATGGGVAAKLISINGGQFANRNKVMNGGMQVAQRRTSKSSITSGDYYVCDRWKLGYGTAGTWTISQSTDTPDYFGNSLKLDCTSANTSLSAGSNLQIQQFFEGQDLQDVGKGGSTAKEITVSFYVKTNKTGTYIVELMDHDNSNRHCGKSYTVSNTNWNRYTLTFPADTTGALDNNKGKSFELGFWLVAGGTFQGSSLQETWGNLSQGSRAVGQVNLADSTSNEWLLTGVQLEIGSVATEFEHKTFAQELLACKRYYSKSYTYDVEAGTSSAFADQIVNRYAPNDVSNRIDLGTRFEIEMRTTPTMTIYRPDNGASGNLTNYGTAEGEGSGSGVGQGTIRGLGRKGIIGFSLAASKNNSVGYHYEASAEF